MTRITLWATLALLTTITFAYAQRDGDQPREGDRPPREGQRERGPRDGEGPFGRGFRPPEIPLMVALDANKDGEISTEEMEKAVAALKSLDKNEDGVLDRQELRPEFGNREGRGPRDGEGFRPPRDGDRARNADRPRDGDRPPREGDRPPRDGERPPRDGDRPRAEGDRGPGPEGRGRGPGGGGGPFGGPEAFVDRMMEADTDEDGKLSRKELLKAAQNFGRGRGGRPGGGERPQRPE